MTLHGGRELESSGLRAGAGFFLDRIRDEASPVLQGKACRTLDSPSGLYPDSLRLWTGNPARAKVLPERADYGGWDLRDAVPGYLGPLRG